MRALFILALIVGTVSASWHAWKPGSQYKYELRGRTLAGLHQVSNQYSGILLKGWVVVQPYGENTLCVKVKQPHYADLHANLSSGWSTYVPDNSISYKPLPLTDKPFELTLKNGVVDKIAVDKSLPIWEINMLKGIASQLQVDTQAQNLKKSRINKLPADKTKPMGVYKTMEDSVSGECETLYDISPLPEYVIQNKPMLAPLVHLRGDGHIIDIVKNMNYSNCNQRMVYHFGFTGLTDWEPASSQMGNMLSRAQLQRVIITGTLDHYTIQSSVTTNKIVVAPHLHNSQKGIVVSQMNLTLDDVSSASGAPQPLTDPRVIRSLVYDYNTASQDGNEVYPKQTSSSSSSSSSSSDKGTDSNENSSSSSSNRSRSSSSSENKSQHVQKESSRSRRSVSNMDFNGRKHVTKPSSKPRTDSTSTIDTDKSRASESWSIGSDEHIQSSGELPFSNEAETFRKSVKPVRIKIARPGIPSIPFNSGEKNDTESSSSISNSDSSWESPILRLKPGLSFPPMTNSFQPFTTGKEEDFSKIVKSVVEKVAHQLQDPNVITTLESFNILVETIKNMNMFHIRKIGDELYFPKDQADPKSGNDNHKYLKWVIWRDAVAEAGTGPAILAIKHWIIKNKVKGEEAAQLLVTISQSIKHPTAQHLKALITLVTSSKVKDQPHLNSTGLHIVTDMIGQLHNKQEHHNRFPVHIYGKYIRDKSMMNIVNKTLSYLSKQLKQAATRGDSHKTQVIIRAIGNVAHPQILQIFEPYLEGKIQITDFQRLVIVASLDKMIHIHPKLVRNTVFRIYLNTGETPELRVAAVMQLMKTNPPAEILQHMAQFTNSEHSKQVNSAVKSSIEYAARLTGEHNRILAMNAKSAVNLLTSYEYGVQYSKNYIRDFINNNLDHTVKLSSIQSEDSIIPSSLFYILKRHSGGFTHKFDKLSLMTSSADELMNLLGDQFYHKETSKGESENEPSPAPQWTVEKISDMLNVTHEKADQVEGNFRFSWAGRERFLTFDNNTVEQLPSMLRDAVDSIKGGKSFNYTKIFNQYTIKVGFPTDMGLPFFFSLEVPTVVSIGGEAQLQTYPDLSKEQQEQIKLPQTANLTVEIKMMYASKTQAKLGFSTLFDKQQYLAGYDSGIQINAPIRMKIDADLENTQIAARLQPLNPQVYQKIAEYSTMAYTTYRKLNDFNPPQLSENVEITHVRPIKRFEVTSGQQNTGFAFDLKAETEQKFFDYAYFLEDVQKTNLLTALLQFNRHQAIKPYTNYTIAYNPQKTSAEFAKLVFNYESSSGHSGSGDSKEDQNAAIPSNTSPDSQKRVHQFLDRVSSGIQDAYAQAVDVSLEFNGETSAHYIATAAYGRSSASHKSRVLVFLSKDPAKTTGENKPYQVAVDLITKAPKVPLTNYKEAMEADPTSSICANINFGEKVESGGYMKIKSKLRQSREYRERLEQVPMTMVCEKQMSNGNHILPACRNVTARANFLDKYSFNVDYNGVPEEFKNLTYKAYSIVREMAYAYVSEDVMVSDNENGHLNLDVDFSPSLDSANVTIESPNLNVAFTELRVGDIARTIFVFHPEYSAYHRLGQFAMRSQQYPTCVADKEYATTFDNTTYPLSLGKCWHVMVQSTPYYRIDLTKDHQSPNNSVPFSVLVRDVENDQREVMMVLGEYVVTFLPDADYFLVNGQKRTILKDSTTHYKNNEGKTIVKAYRLPHGNLRIHVPTHGFDIIYDGYRVKFQIPNAYRSKVRGLCGNFDGEKSTDFMTPQNCILPTPLEFTATYAIPDQTCEKQSIHHLRLRAEAMPCYNKTAVRGDVISDFEAGRRPYPQMRAEKLTDITSLNKVNQNRVQACGIYANLIVHRGGYKCFSKSPQLQCVGKCQKPVKRAPKQIEFSCLPEAHGKLFTNLDSIPKTISNQLVPKEETVWAPLECA